MAAAKGLAPLLCLLLTASPFVGAAPPPEPPEVPPLPVGPSPDEALAEAHAAIVAAQAAVAAAQAEAQGRAEGAAADALAAAATALAEAEAQADAARRSAAEAAADAAARAADAVARAGAEVAAARATLEGEAAAKAEAARQAVADAQAALAQAQADGRDAACREARPHLLAAPIVVWTSCNMGPGSGLDADTLDGLTAATFLGLLDAEAAARAGGDAGLAAADEVLAARLDGLDLQVEGRAWRAVLDRDGAGSGLDADRLDGLDGAQLLRSDRDGTLRGSLRVEEGGVHVLSNWPANDRGIASNLYGASTWGSYGFDDGPVQHVANNLQFITASKQALSDGQRPVRMKISQNGNVGIGTTAPGFELEVDGGDTVALFRNPRPAGYTGVVVGQDSNGNGGSLQYMSRGWRGNSGSAEEVARGNNFEIYNQHPTGNLTFHTANSIVPKMSITSAGNVGVGRVAPQGRFHVEGSLIAGGGAADKDMLVVMASSKAFPSSDGSFNDWSANGAFWASPMIYRSKRVPDHGGGAFPDNNYGELMLQGTSHGNQYNRGISLITSPNDATAPAIRLRVAPTGQVGIGTTSPGASLHVLDGQPGGRGVIAVQASAENAYVSLKANAAGAGSDATLVKLGPNQGAGSAGTLKLNNAPSSFENHLVIAPNGNVGVGTGSPQSTLEVGGYVQLARTSGAPPAADCDAANERGRMKVDASAGLLYVCMDSGWVAK